MTKHFSCYPLLRGTGRTRWGRAIFKLEAELVYEVGRNGTGLRITIPKGYETDFASVPWFLWPLLPPTGKHGRSAIVHDYCSECYSGFSRIVGDGIFLEAMRHDNVWWWRRTLMYCGVRLYWICYGKWKHFFFGTSKYAKHCEQS